MIPKSVKCYQNMGEFSYANSVLQAFIQLECVQNWFHQISQLNIINHPYFNQPLTKDLYYLIQSISGNVLDSTQLILDFDLKSKNFWNKDIKKDPFHFLFYFLDILHYELNVPKNINFDSNLYNKSLYDNIHSDNNMFNLFINFMEQTQNSFISDNFFSIQKYMSNCPICKSMFSYDFKKIFRFDLDYLLNIRNQCDPINMRNNLSLNNCFQYSSNTKTSKCCSCNYQFSSQCEQIFQTSNILIFSFKRMNHTFNYKCDLRFYENFDVSNFIINKNSSNKNYKLKAVISFWNNKYYANIFFNGNYFRIVDSHINQMNPYDVIQINVNQLLDYEPILLIYEINYQNNLKQSQMVPNFSFQHNMPYMMNLNLNFVSSNQMAYMGNNLLSTKLGFNLKFKVIPQNWDGKKEGTFPITIQVLPENTVKYAVDKFYQKLVKPREAIIKFSYNNIDLDPNSNQILNNLNINSSTIIYALKSLDFDELKLS